MCKSRPSAGAEIPAPPALPPPTCPTPMAWHPPPSLRQASASSRPPPRLTEPRQAERVRPLAPSPTRSFPGTDVPLTTRRTSRGRRRRRDGDPAGVGTASRESTPPPGQWLPPEEPPAAPCAAPPPERPSERKKSKMRPSPSPEYQEFAPPPRGGGATLASSSSAPVPLLGADAAILAAPDSAAAALLLDAAHGLTPGFPPAGTVAPPPVVPAPVLPAPPAAASPTPPAAKAAPDLPGAVGDGGGGVPTPAGLPGGEAGSAGTTGEAKAAPPQATLPTAKTTPGVAKAKRMLKLRDSDNLDPRQQETLARIMELDPQARRAWEEYGLTYRVVMDEHRSRIKHFQYMARRSGREPDLRTALQEAFQASLVGAPLTMHRDADSAAAAGIPGSSGASSSAGPGLPVVHTPAAPTSAPSPLPHPDASAFVPPATPPPAPPPTSPPDPPAVPRVSAAGNHC